MGAIFLLALFANVAVASSAAAEKAVVPFIDGMSITTDNVSATIEVRARSLGPGLCATRFVTGTHAVDILAPLTDWSDWQELTAHFGSVSFSISSVILCSTGAVAEVRYFPTVDQ